MAKCSGKPWYGEVVGESENEQGEGTQDQADEARKNENMNHSCGHIPRVLPLSQPDLEDPA